MNNTNALSPDSQSAGGFVQNNLGEVLFVQEFGEFWGLPRGHVEGGETLLEAAKREIFEETGIDELDFVYPLGSYTRSTFGSDGEANGIEIKEISFFYFTTQQNSLSPKDGDITDAKWLDVSDARLLIINDEDLKFFDKCVDRISQ